MPPLLGDIMATPPTITTTTVINKALRLVGAATVDSIDDGSNNALILTDIYDIALRSILSECKWNFATTRSTLSVTGSALPWYDSGITTVYEKPADLIRIFDTDDDDATWHEEADYIITDTSGLGLRYVFYLDDPSKYSAEFLQAFIDRLCSDIAYAIVNSASLGEKYLTKYEKISLPKAMAANSQGGTQQTIKDDAWELAKYSDTQTNT